MDGGWTWDLPRAEGGLHGVPHARWRLCLEDAGNFFSRWGLQAQKLGWSARDLLGLHPEARLARHDQIRWACCGPSKGRPSPISAARRRTYRAASSSDGEDERRLVAKLVAPATRSGECGIVR
jgi:hypothetical protein